MLKVLLVDRDASRIDRVHARLEAVHGRDLDMQVEGRTELAVGWLERQPFDVVLLAVDESADWAMELETLCASADKTPIVLLGGVDFSETPEVVRLAAEIVVVGEGLPEDLPRRLDAVVARWPVEMRLLALERQRDERTELLESVLAVVEKPVLIAAGSGEVTNASPTCVDLFSGYAQELRGVALSDLVAEEDRSRFATFTSDLSNREWVESDRFRLTTQSAGQTMPIRGTAVPSELEGAWTVLAFDDTITVGMRSSAPDGAVADVLVGLFQLLGLDDVRDALGDSWPELEARVYSVVERVLGENLMVHDHFWRNHDGDYLVLFERCSREQATTRARELVRRIKSAVIGAQDLKDAFKNNERIDERQAAAFGDVRLTISEIPLESEMLRREAEPSSIIEKKLRAVRAKTREALRSQLAALKGKLRPKHCAARTRSGAASPLLFLDLEAQHREQIASLARQANDDADLLLEIDAFHLDLHTDLLIRGDAAANTLAVVDVHAASLSCKRSRAHYQELGCKLPSAVHGRMVFNIVGVEPGTYAPRLRQMASSLVPLARFASVQFTKPKADAVDLQEAGIPLVTCDYADIAPMLATRPERFARFLRYVHDQKARLVLRRVPSAMERETADTLSIDLISSC